MASSNKAFLGYLTASMAYGCVRTIIRTNGAMMYDRSCKDDNKRKLLFTERVFAVMGASFVGAYMSPVYLASDLCSMDKAMFIKSSDLKPCNVKVYNTVLAPVFDLEY